MFQFNLPEGLVTSFTGSLLALLSAALIWFLKSAYEKHRAEKLALAKFERIFLNNLIILKDNFDFIDKWIASLENNRPYNVYLEKYFIDEEATFKISNLKLVGSILTVNYKLRRTSLDLDNLYKSYWEVIFKIDSIEDIAVKEANITEYHKNVKDALRQIKENYEPLKKDLVHTIALLRTVDKIRIHSLFGYISLLFVDIFPKVSDVAIEREVKKINNNSKDLELGEKTLD